jgi:hypothetical protein
LVHIASLVGFEVEPMELSQRRTESRDAVLILRTEGRGKTGGIILYNPDRPAGRIAFSLGHEIAHTFFPTSSGGARFRGMCSSDSREANELERLCDLGAAELLMPIDEFRESAGRDWSLAQVPRLAQQFGSSFEASAFRLASAHPGVAAAGLLKYRRRKEEQRAAEALQQPQSQAALFRIRARATQPAEPRYRRQSFHTSDLFPGKLVVHWNKSFDVDSIVYRAAEGNCLLRAEEALPCSDPICGFLEAIPAPYQREDAAMEHPDLIFFWVAR